MSIQTFDEFIRSEIEKPFVWGETDCCSTANRWVHKVTGKSPLDIYGRKHSNEEGARKWLSENGGIVTAINNVMKSAEIPETKRPFCGDIGIIIIYENMACMALNTKNSWFTRNESGIIVAPHTVHVLKAWKICPELSR